jgi:arylsulfatase A-like enzyme
MNVIVIISDTFRRDHLGCYGNTWIKTPHIDEFAGKACVFDRAFTGSFPTVPLRNDIMTGRYSFTYKDWSPLADNEVVLSQCLNKAGVYTGLVVDTPHPFRPRYDYQRHFQAWEVIRGQENDEWKPGPTDEELEFPCNPDKLRGGRHGATAQHIRNNMFRRNEQDYFPARTMSTAAQWLEANRRKPFFLYVDTFDPHEPWDAPQQYVDLYDPGYEGEKVTYPRYWYTDFLSERELKHCRAMYAAECSLVDRWVGFLLDRVKTLGLEENTAIFFLSDHGFWIGEHGVIGKGLINEQMLVTLPLYTEVSHIPFIVRLPGQKTQRRIKSLAQPTDLMPTVLELMGASVPPSVKSKSLKPILDGNQDKVHEITVTSPALYTPQMEHASPWRRSTVTDGRWLMIYGAQNFGKQSGTISTPMVDNLPRVEATIERTPPRIELYDLEADPGCNRDVLSTHRDQARRLHRQHVQFLKEQGIPEKFLQPFTVEP